VITIKELTSGDLAFVEIGIPLRAFLQSFFSDQRLPQPQPRDDHVSKGIQKWRGAGQARDGVGLLIHGLDRLLCPLPHH